MQYNFEWDPVKAKKNLKKHGVSFEEASEIFLDPLQLSLLDNEHSEQEERWIHWAIQNPRDYVWLYILIWRIIKIK